MPRPGYLVSGTDNYIRRGQHAAYACRPHAGPCSCAAPIAAMVPPQPIAAARSAARSALAVVSAAARRGRGARAGAAAAGLDIFPMGWGSEVLIRLYARFAKQGWWVVDSGSLDFCEKYGKLARTDLKNERISRSGGFEACYEIIRGVEGVGWSESRALNLSIQIL
jgi:hypothetical protein